MYLVIIGFATRAFVDAARKSKKEICSILIVEPDVRVFHQTLKREYIVDLIQDENIDILVGIPPGELGWHVYKAFTATPKAGPRASKAQALEFIQDTFVYPVIDGKHHPTVTETIQIVSEASKQVYLSMGCASDTFYRWEQTHRNIDTIQNSYQVKSLFDKFKDIPVIVVGGGPSVEDFIKACKEYDLTKKALIICVDASLPRLLREGIRPHMVTRCERKFTTIFQNLKKDDTKDIYYAAYPWTPPEFFELFENKIMLFRDNGVCRWTEYDPGSVNGGVSSGNAALEMAYLFGSQKIFLTGIDLSFIDGKSHVTGTEVEFDLEKSRPKWTEVLANDGSKTTTIPVWNRCLQEYKNAIQKHVDKKAVIYNTSLKGAKIEGTQVLSWKDSLTHFEKELNPLELIKSNLTVHVPEYKTKYEEKRKSAIKLLKEVQYDLMKLFLNLDDSMLSAQREEERVVNQVKTHYDPKDFFHNVKAILGSLGEMYKTPCKTVDDFKSKYFSNADFNLLVIDMCLVDIFHTENKLFGLKNVIENEYERLKTYVGYQAVLYKLFQVYVDRMLRLLEEGPKGYNYTPIPFELDQPEIQTEVKMQNTRLIIPGSKKQNLKETELIISP